MPQTSSYPKVASVSYNASYRDAAVDALIEAYGDFLQGIDIADKLHLLGILATYQGQDTDYARDPETYCQWSLEDAHTMHSCTTSEELDAVMELLVDNELSDSATFSLMVAIANQLVAECQ